MLLCAFINQFKLSVAFSVVYLDSIYDVIIRNGVLNANFKLDAVIRQYSPHQMFETLLIRVRAAIAKKINKH